MRSHFWLVLAWIVCLYSVVFILPQKVDFDYSYEKDVIKVEAPQTLWHLANFDGAHYQNISRWGYISNFQTAFFPLYPLATHTLGLITSNNLISGLLISLIASFIAANLFYRLTKSTKALLALLTFPLSFFLLANYTESLFLTLSLFCWLLFSQRKYFWSGVVGFFCALTRFYGLLLFPVLLLEFIINLKAKDRLNPKAYLPALSLLLIPLGLLTYMYYLGINFNDPILFIHSLGLWNKATVTLPPQTVYRYFKILTTVSPRIVQYWIALLELSALILGLSASVVLYLKKQYSYSLYLFLGAIIPSFNGTLQSNARYLLVLFPLFILYKYLPKYIYLPIIIVSFILQLVFFSFFLTGVFVA